MTEPRKRKCRWCEFLIPATPKGYAELWKHVRRRHPEDLIRATWPEKKEVAHG